MKKIFRSPVGMSQVSVEKRRRKKTPRRRSNGVSEWWKNRPMVVRGRFREEKLASSRENSDFRRFSLGTNKMREFFLDEQSALAWIVKIARKKFSDSKLQISAFSHSQWPNLPSNQTGISIKKVNESQHKNLHNIAAITFPCNITTFVNSAEFSSIIFDNRRFVIRLQIIVDLLRVQIQTLSHLKKALFSKRKYSKKLPWIPSGRQLAGTNSNPVR